MNSEYEQNLDQLQYELIETLNIHQNLVTAISISNDDKLLASGSNRLGFKSKYAIKIWNLQNNSIILELKGPQYVYYTIFSQNNKFLAAAGQNPYDIFVYNIQRTNNQLPLSILRRQESTIHRFIFTLDNQQLISCTQDKYLKMWSVAQSKKISVKQLLSPIYDISISKNEDIGICKYDGYGIILSKQLQIKCQWIAHKNKTFSIKFIQDSQIILTSGRHEIRFWSVQELLSNKNICLKEIKYPESSELWVLTIYPPINPKVVVIYNGKIEFILLKSEQSILSISIPGGLWNQTIAISSNIKSIFTASITNTIKIYKRIN